MERIEQIVDRGLGHLGLFLIGAISWVADRAGPAPRPVPRSPSRGLPRHAAGRAAA